MARLNVTPTRMELKRLNKRLAIAKRGHKMLKDKQDSLVQEFFSLRNDAAVLRTEVEDTLRRINNRFVLASSTLPDDMLSLNMEYESTPVEAEVERKQVLGIDIPKFSPVYMQETDDSGSLYPYSFESTTSDIDDVSRRIGNLIPLMLELAEKEKACQILSDEIRATRRRVNALEYRTIVDLEETISYILMKIDETERNTTARLMKLEL